MTDRAADELGSYMLKGWILTDRTCPNSGCKWPLLRSPKDSSIHFCANCDRDARESSSSAVARTAASSSSGSAASHNSRSSTPPTEVSRATESPTFELPPESEASIRRREQSDFASAEIGKRLLRGWAMLAEECPNNSCYGVPLVRPPNPSTGTKDSRMECVICEQVYTSEVDSRGFARLIPFSNQQGLQQPTVSSALPNKVPAKDRPMSATSVNETPMEEHPPIDSSRVSCLDASVQALEGTLMTLSQRLAAIRGDPHNIGLTADAMTKTVQALTMVKQLQWSEQQNSFGLS